MFTPDNYHDYVIIGLVNGLVSIRRKTIIGTNDDI